MLYREIIAVYSEIRTKHITSLCGQNVKFVSVKYRLYYSNQCVVNIVADKPTCSTRAIHY